MSWDKYIHEELCKIAKALGDVSEALEESNELSRQPVEITKQVVQRTEPNSTIEPMTDDEREGCKFLMRLFKDSPILWKKEILFIEYLERNSKFFEAK